MGLQDNVRSRPKICSDQGGFEDETALSTLQRNLLGSSFLQLLRWPQHEPSAFKISKTQNLHIAFLRFVLFD